MAFGVLAWRRWRTRSQREINPELDLLDAEGWGVEAHGHHRRYEHSLDVDSLHKSIELWRAAVGASRGHPEGLRYVTGLMHELWIRFRHLGRISDLDDAMACGRDAAAVTVPLTDPNRPALLLHLADILTARFEATGDEDDLRQAQRLADEARALLASPDVGRNDLLAVLARVHLNLYEVTRDRDHLEQAIANKARALRAVLQQDASDRGPRLAGLRAGLAFLHHTRYLVYSGSPWDLDRAEVLSRDALATSGADEDPLVSASALMQLSTALVSRWDAGKGDRATLDEAVEVAEEAVARFPVDHVDHSRAEGALAKALFHRFLDSRADADLQRADNLFVEVVSNSSAPVSTRVAHAAFHGMHWARLGRWRRAVESYEAAVRLLPRLAPRGLARASQEQLLQDHSSLATDAAAAAIAASEEVGEPAADRGKRAAVLLEQGRGLLLAQTLDLRADLAPLRDRDPRLAHELEQLRRDLHALSEVAGDFYEVSYEQERDELSAIGPAAGAPAARVGELRRLLITRWDSLLAEIRELPGLEGFLDMPTIGTLLEQSSRGPIVLLNVSVHRSDALILRPSGVTALPLPGADADSVASRLGLLQSALDGHLPSGDTTRDVLRWLWTEIAGAVLDELGEDTERVWWVPTGRLAFLPIHAAGDDRHPGQSVLDRVVSSYVPTVRALAHARAASVRHRPAEPIAIAMSKTCGHAPLPSAVAEAEVVRRRFPATLLLRDEQATNDRVLQELPRRAIAHFACHGAANVDDPSRGLLYLHDWSRHPLTVAAVSRLDLRGTELAYLSACGTARLAPSTQISTPELRHRGTQLADEVIHLASAFQLAGYPHVIGTLWQVRDDVGLQFAKEIYRKLGHHEPAVAMHQAVCALRELYPDDASQWASFVHLGP